VSPTRLLGIRRLIIAAMIAVTLSISSPVSAAIGIDANVSVDKNSASTTVATPAFSTALGNELLLAFVTGDYVSGINTQVSSITGAGLTWTLVVRTNVEQGTSEIWRAFATRSSTHSLRRHTSRLTTRSVTLRNNDEHRVRPGAVVHQRPPNQQHCGAAVDTRVPEERSLPDPVLVVSRYRHDRSKESAALTRAESTDAVSQDGKRKLHRERRRTSMDLAIPTRLFLQPIRRNY